MELDLLFDRYMILAGDRRHGEDVAVTAGVAWVDGMRCVFASAEETLASAAAYTKAARMLRLAGQTGAPCVHVGSMATSHLDSVSDGRSAAALDAYARTVATATCRRVAVLEGDTPPDLAEDFDATVSPSAGDSVSGASYTPGDAASARAALARVLRDLADGAPSP
ncbi:hypothetical protein CMK11_07050 [Candidatus Poribacteria bacterium]|nr:hypothetical protein [Candidatus Poribacteria bacterium]